MEKASCTCVSSPVWRFGLSSSLNGIDRNDGDDDHDDDDSGNDDDDNDNDNDDDERGRERRAEISRE